MHLGGRLSSLYCGQYQPRLADNWGGAGQMGGSKMRAAASLLLLVVLAAVARADELAEKAAKVVKATKSAVETIEKLEADRSKTLEVVKKARVRPGQTVARYAPRDPERKVPIAVTFGSQEDKQKAIEEWEQKLKAMQMEKERVRERDFFFGWMPKNPSVGDFGQMHNVEVLQVLAPNRLLIIYGGDILSGTTIMVEGIDTKDVADNQRWNIEPIMEITGTYRYTSTTGAARTVLKAEPMDLEPVRAYIREHKLMEK